MSIPSVSIRNFLLGKFFPVFLMIGVIASAELDADPNYKKICAACHQVNGEGSEGVYPPLKGWANRLASSEEGRRYLVQVVSFGMNDEVEIDGVSYIGYMPPNPQLKDKELADVLNYILKDLSKDKKVRKFSEKEVTRVRKNRASMQEVVLSRKKAIASLK